MNKIISNASPASCSATKDFKSALNVAGVVFIHYITALCVLLQRVAPSLHWLRICCRAATKASDSGKATLSLDHVLDALKDAGFEDMVSAVALQVNGTNSQRQRSCLNQLCMCACSGTVHFMQLFQPSRTNNQKRNGVQLKPVLEAPKSRKVSRAFSNEALHRGTNSLALKGDSLAEEDGGDDEDEEEGRNKDGSASEEEQNGDGENDDA